MTEPQAGPLSNIPADLRRRILRGIRWSVLLSALAAPFGYCTTVVMARLGPEVIGTYGLLAVYTAAVSGIFYLGGDAVVIRFLPEMRPAERQGFMVSYFLVVAAALLPWLVGLLVRPDISQYVFGPTVGGGLAIVVLCLSPLYIGYSMVVASLKATLEVPAAQAISRGVTVVSCLVYAALALVARSFFSAYCAQILWSVFLGLTLGGAIIGSLRLRSTGGFAGSFRRPGLWLPAGFWRYALALQQQSVVSVISRRLDYIVLLNAAGVVVLGKYVAMAATAQIVVLLTTYFLDPLLPSLTNVLARKDTRAASELFGTTLRTNFAVSAALGYGLILFVDELSRIMGSEYTALKPAFALMIGLTAISAPGLGGGTLLTAVGRQQRAVFVALGRLCLFLVLFAWMWPKWQMLGAVVAYGAAGAVEGVALLLAAKYGTAVKFGAVREYAAFILVTAAVISWSIHPASGGIPARVAAWFCAMAVLFSAAGYKRTECEELIRCFIPCSVVKGIGQRTAPRGAAGAGTGPVF